MRRRITRDTRILGPGGDSPLEYGRESLGAGRINVSAWKWMETGCNVERGARRRYGGEEGSGWGVARCGTDSDDVRAVHMTIHVGKPIVHDALQQLVRRRIAGRTDEDARLPRHL